MISLKLLHLLLQLFYSSLFISGKKKTSSIKFFLKPDTVYVLDPPPPQLPQKTTTILLQLPVFEKMTNWWLITSHCILTNVTCHIFFNSNGTNGWGGGRVRKLLTTIPQAQVVPRSPNPPGSEINIQSKCSGPKANVHSGSNPLGYAHTQQKWDTNNKKDSDTWTHQGENRKSTCLGY